MPAVPEPDDEPKGLEETSFPGEFFLFYRIPRQRVAGAIWTK